MSLDYVIHAPKYSHRSAGFRALYVLANKLQQAGKVVTISELPLAFLYETKDPNPYEFRPWDSFLPAEKKHAIHVYPEIALDTGYEKAVKWILNANRDRTNDDKFLLVDWIGAEAPRLCVDIIERELFYPKDSSGVGLALFGGKYGDTVFRNSSGESIVIPPDILISREFPETREGLAHVLRSVEGVISYDNNSCLNLEAIICGTPVLMARGELPGKSLFPDCGYITNPDDFYDANEAAKGAFDQYDKVRELIKDDVTDFIALCEENWG